MPAAFTFYIPKRTCVNYLQLQQAKKWSFKLSKFEQFLIQWYTPFASLLGLTSHFAGLVQKSTGFIFIFIFFSDFQRCQVAMKNEDLVMTENLHDKLSYWIMKWILYYIFLGVYFDNSVLASAFYITF